MSKTQWIYEPNSFRPLAQINQQGEDAQPQLSYIITDHAGTASELCDESGSILWHGHQALWGEFSETHTDKDNPITCDLRYQGQIHDKETGLYYNRHRYYDSNSCQYLSSDPIGLAGGIRPQSYVADAVNWVDPLGLDNVRTGAGRTHVTYQGIKNGKPYTGYASAPSSANLSADEIVSRRYGGNFSEFGGRQPKPVYEGTGIEGKQTARGMEQRLYEKDVSQYGKEGVANKQNPVGPNNKNRDVYLKKADEHIKKTQIDKPSKKSGKK